MAYVIGRYMASCFGKERLPGDIMTEEEAKQLPSFGSMLANGTLYVQGSEPADLKAKAPAPKSKAKTVANVTESPADTEPPPVESAGDSEAPKRKGRKRGTAAGK